MTRALIVVDVQNDFVEGGSLAVAGGTAVAWAIAARLEAARRGQGAGWEHVVATRDHHVDPGAHFSDHPDFVDSWPRHCVVGTPGQQLQPALHEDEFEAVFDKGSYSAAYSGFEGTIGGEPSGEGLEHWLRGRGVSSVDVVGIATDHCVRATALDAARAGFDTTVLLDLTAAVALDRLDTTLDEMRAAGVTVTGDAPLR